MPPTHTLFGVVFPDKMLCLQYKQRRATADPAAGARFEGGARGASTHEAKYGVQWESDAASTQCRLCGGKWGLLRRRHHCRACGKVLCGACCGDKHPLHYLDGREGRVCTECRCGYGPNIFYSL